MNIIISFNFRSRSNGSFFVGAGLEYLDLASIKYYSDCEPLVSGLGYLLVDLSINRRNNLWQIRAVIASKNASVGIDDCKKVHQVLLPRLEALLQSQDTYMEVTSPGLERLIKNAAEFSLFVGKNVKVWSSDVSDWVYGNIESSDENTLFLKVRGDNTIASIPYKNISKAKLDYIQEAGV